MPGREGKVVPSELVEVAPCEPVGGQTEDVAPSEEGQKGQTAVQTAVQAEEVP